MIPIKEAVTISLSVAVVIMAETLLAENNFAQKNGYRINDNQEILAFSAGNFVAAFTGCCPIERLGIPHCDGRTVSGQDAAYRHRGGRLHDRTAFMRHGIHRISAGSGADRDRHLGAAWGNGV